MSTTDPELDLRISKATAEYLQYQETQKQKKFVAPVASISIEDSGNGTTVFMDVEYNGQALHLASMKREDAEKFQFYLNSQPLVQEKYADGKTVDAQETQQRVNTFVERFENPKSPLFLLSGFVASDPQTDTFLGVCNLGGSTKDGYTEIAGLSRPDAWSHTSVEIIEKYAIAPEKKLSINYPGAATAGICALFQYAGDLKKRGNTVKGHPLEGIAMTARLDNPGSWKLGAKLNMVIDGIDTNPKYGPELRYQLSKAL